MLISIINFSRLKFLGVAKFEQGIQCTETNISSQFQTILIFWSLRYHTPLKSPHGRIKRRKRRIMGTILRCRTNRNTWKKRIKYHKSFNERLGRSRQNCWCLPQVPISWYDIRDLQNSRGLPSQIIISWLPSSYFKHKYISHSINDQWNTQLRIYGWSLMYTHNI